MMADDFSGAGVPCFRWVGELYEFEDNFFESSVMGDNVSVLDSSFEVSDRIGQIISNHPDGFHVAHFNAKSLSHNIEDVRYYLGENRLQALGISETWLTENTPSNLVDIDGYTLVRNDRSRSRGGGVAFYINSGLKFNVFDQSDSSEVIKYLLIDLALPGEKVLLGVVYRTCTRYTNVCTFSRCAVTGTLVCPRSE